jgi:hypothetical protein
MQSILLQASAEAVGFLVVLIISIAIFFAIRGILLWYWKVDAILKNQEETNRLLKVIAGNLVSKKCPDSNPDNEIV